MEEEVVVAPRRRLRLDPVPERLEQRRRLLGRPHAGRVDRRLQRRLGRHRHAQRARVGADLLGEGPRRRRAEVRVAELVAGEHVEHRRRVRDRARDRAARREPVDVAEGGGGDAAARGLQAEEPAAGGRDPDRAAAVRALGGRREPRRDRRGRAAARAARRPRRVPGVAADPVQLRVRQRDQAELGRVRLADHDEAGAAQPGDAGAVGRRDPAGEGAARERRPDAGDLVEVLDRQRHAGEGAGVGLARLRQRLLGADGHERVQLRVVRLDPAEVELDQLDGGHLAGRDERRLLERRGEGEPARRPLAHRASGSGDRRRRATRARRRSGRARRARS